MFEFPIKFLRNPKFKYKQNKFKCKMSSPQFCFVPIHFRIYLNRKLFIFTIRYFERTREKTKLFEIVGNLNCSDTIYVNLHFSCKIYGLFRRNVETFSAFTLSFLEFTYLFVIIRLLHRLFVVVWFLIVVSICSAFSNQNVRAFCPQHCNNYV